MIVKHVKTQHKYRTNSKKRHSIKHYSAIQIANVNITETSVTKNEERKLKTNNSFSTCVLLLKYSGIKHYKVSPKD